MGGLKLIAAGICGSALTLGLTSWAQAPKRPATECGDPTALYHLERDVARIDETTLRIEADEKSTLDWARFVSSDLSSIAISLRSR